MSADNVSAHGHMEVVAGDVLTGTYDWRLDRRLGTGGYGTVFRATRTSAGGDPRDSTPRLAAVKVFHTPEGGDPRMLLRRELAALLALHSDRIPRVHDHRIDDQLCFVAMAYYPHGSLHSHLRHDPRLSEPEAWKLLRDMLTALRTAHRAAILHLDIKPANVLLDGQGGYVLTDFGISQGSHVGSEITASGLGSVGYQSPEQRDRQFDMIDTRTDLWGVGITVWSVVTGMRLHKSPELYLSDGYHAVPSPRSLKVKISRQLDAAIMSLVVRDPAGRPGGAAEFLSHLRKTLRGEGVTGQTNDRAQTDFEEEQAREVIEGLLDELWATVCSGPGAGHFLVRYRDAELLCEAGEHSHFAFVLLRGSVLIERGGRLLHTETREGTFLGEVAALTGGTRTATMRAKGEVWGMRMNAAELEEFIALNPGVGIRMIHTLAERLVRESGLNA